MPTHTISRLGITFCILFLLNPASIPALENTECLECHDNESLTRENSTGMKDLLSINDARFKYSVHNVNGVGCVDCHTNIEELNMDNDLPHSPDLGTVVCEGCHEDVGEAYTDSVHKKAGKKGVVIACYACHEYHYTTPLSAATVSERQNNFCRKCHDPDRFHEWLPQKETHFDFVECTVCHAPETARNINLRLFDLLQDRFIATEELLRILGVEVDGFMNLVDHNQDESISEEEFLDLVLVLRQRGVRAVFHGELITDIEPSVHQVNKGVANRECKLCHSIDSPFFQDVRFTLTLDNTTVEAFQVDRNVLSTYHVELNAPGGTRLRLLDRIGLLLIAGGLFLTGSHLTVRLITVNKRRNTTSGTGHGEEAK